MGGHLFSLRYFDDLYSNSGDIWIFEPKDEIEMGPFL